EGSDEPFTFALFGDNRGNGSGAHDALVELLSVEAPDFVLQTGDLVVHGSREEDWHSFLTITGPLIRDRTLWPALGNHDLTGAAGAEAFRRYFVLPESSPAPERYYSFRYGNSLFIALD